MVSKWAVCFLLQILVECDVLYWNIYVNNHFITARPGADVRQNKEGSAVSLSPDAEDICTLKVNSYIDSS